MKVNVKRSLVAAGLVSIVAGALGVSQFSFYVIPPGGMAPQGKILLTSKLENINFVDSPKAMCKRQSTGAPDEWCQVSAIAFVVDNSTIFARLPYVKFSELVMPR